jgi:class 3 adenylate cyclase/alpha-beta hydrolase superfamily lysophospholipase
MEPRIQYATTTDGVNIAFATIGEGQPVVWAHTPIASHVQLEWQQPTLRPFLSTVAAQAMLVRFDPRGVGLSDRDVEDFSIDARVCDLEAVAHRLGLTEFALLAVEDGGLASITYAARYPDRVSRLVLVNCYARPAEPLGTTRTQSLLRLVDDWEMFAENVGAFAFGYGREEARRYGEFIRACITPEIFLRWQQAQEAIDLTEALAEIRAPTLVIRHSGITWITMDSAKQLAARIPNARLTVVEGMYLDNPTQLATAVSEFLSEGGGIAPAQAPLAKADIHTILFTDVEGSTALTQRLGDARGRDLLREHERIVREALKAHGGSELKTMGDGFMASFSSATKALECSIAMQRAFAAHNESAEEPILVRAGLNAGEPIAEEEDLFGTAVIEAARIAAAAKGGEILVSDVVRQLAKGKDFRFADRGEVDLKGFDEPVRLYEVRWREAR